MPIATTFGPFLDALKVQLDARVAPVVVSTGWVGEDGGLESIQFDAVKTTEGWGQIGNRSLEEVYDVDGFIYIVRAGAGEKAIKAARDRAKAILDLLIDQLRTDPRVNGTVRVARVSAWDAEQGVSANGERVCRITFTVHVEARLTAS